MSQSDAYSHSLIHGLSKPVAHGGNVPVEECKKKTIVMMITVHGDRCISNVDCNLIYFFCIHTTYLTPLSQPGIKGWPSTMINPFSSLQYIIFFCTKSTVGFVLKNMNVVFKCVAFRELARY